MKMHRFHSIFLALCVILLLPLLGGCGQPQPPSGQVPHQAIVVGQVDGADRTVRIGVYQNEPKVFRDANGHASGFFIDLVEEIAIREGWTLVYVPCEWAECLVALEEGRIDLMPDVAYSPARDEKYDFHSIPVAESWSRLYAHPRVQINRINELDGLRVTVLEGSIQQAVFEQTMNGFGLEVAIVPAESLEEAFRLVTDGSADAAIANHFYGDYFYQAYGLVKTAIVFNVVTLHYATAQGRNPDLLEAIDRHLGAWLEEPNSIYYTTLSRWMEQAPVYRVPQYVDWVIGITGGLLAVAVGMVLLLRGQVQARTRHLAQANERLQRAEELLRLAMEATSDGIWDWYPQSGQMYWSARSYTMLGYQPDEFPMNLERWTELLHPDDRDRVWEAVQCQINNGDRSFSIEFRCRRKDDRWGWINGRGKVVALDDDGAIQRVIGTYTDITARKRAEKALRENEERYRLISTVASDYMFSTRLDADGKLVLNWVAGAFEKITGYTFEEYIAHGGWRAALHPDDLAVDDRDMEKLRANQPLITEIRTLTKSGRTVWVRVYAHPVWDAERKELVGIYGAVQDITARKQAETEREQLLAQIEAQARQVQQIVETVPTGVLLLDAAGRVLLANPVAERGLVALSAGDGDRLTHLGDRSLTELLTSPPTGLWHEARAGAHIFEIVARPIVSGSLPEHWVFVIHDATQERQVREELQRQERLAAIGQLAAGIAHDFNNIMAIIILHAQMAARSAALAARDRERLATINEQAHHATQLIQQILDFSRRAVLERQPLDLLSLLKEQVQLLGRTLPEHIAIRLDHGGGEYTVNADPTRMQQMVMNLAVNARDAMPEGGVLSFALERITVEPGASPLLPELAAGDWIRLSVVDTGVGIPPEVLPHIFEPFYTTKPPGRGSGLGLAQVHGIVAQHEGRIGVEAQVGAGTTFIVYLPAFPLPADAKLAPVLEEMPRGQGEVVLVVEDNVPLRAALRETLVEWGYQVWEAADGVQALALLEEAGAAFDLVVSDVVMPGMGGVALVHALRERGWTAPVILLSGHLQEQDLAELGAYGVSAWLSKPSMLDQLARVVADALRTKPPGSG
jgi:two-component system cell cycle sensor histidine kinase/response regulator CckA